MITVRDFHCTIRDVIFRQCSPQMNTFERHHPKLMQKKVCQDSIQALVDAEDSYISEQPISTRPGDLLAKAVTPLGFRYFAAHGAAFFAHHRNTPPYPRGNTLEQIGYDAHSTDHYLHVVGGYL